MMDFTVFIKPARKRNSRLASILRSPSPWFDNFRCIKSLSRFVSGPRSSASATAVVIASSCSWAKCLDKLIGTAPSRCWILPEMHTKRRISLSCVTRTCRFLPSTPTVCRSWCLACRRLHAALTAGWRTSATVW